MPSAIRYSIECEKDTATVKCTYDLRAPNDGSALIASFSLTVAGKQVIDQSQWVHGQAEFSGSQFVDLEKPDKDVIVDFSITSNEGWSAADNDKLRGNKRFDDLSFSNT
jgi:hypothetical protein